MSGRYMGLIKNQTDKHPLLDSNVFIERIIPSQVLRQMYLSSVVLYELTATSVDRSTLQLYTSWRKSAITRKRLLTPAASDWFECSKLIRNLLLGSKSRSKGIVSKTTTAQQQQNDALIARTAVLNNCYVVTNNVRDFERFKPYMDGLVVVPANEFLDV